MRLLLIEDEARIVELLMAAFERAGFAVDAVGTAAAGEKALASIGYDAAILDLGLPDGDGSRLLSKIRSAGNRVPVLILTARDSVEDRVEGLDTGADDYLVKPFAVTELVSRIKALLHKTDLRALAAEVVEYLSPWAVAMHCTLGFDAPTAPVWIRGNAPALKDALRNLIENAVFHTRAGTEVTVAVSPSGTVSVADRGPGIPVPDRNHIFERFWRGRGVSRPGAGLGLAIVSEIVRAHHGEIQVSEVSLGGALMLMKIPLYPYDT